MVASCNSGTCNAGGSRDTVQVSWVEFAVLDVPIIPPPTLDTVSVVNSSSLEVNFTAPVDLSNVLSYDIRRFNGTSFETVGNILNGSTLSFVEGDLIADTFYRYHVVSIASSNESDPSNEIGQRTTVILFTAKPDSNPGVRWVNGLGNPPCSDLTTFECVNENTRNDGDFIQTTGLGTSNTDIDIMTLSDIEDPLRSDSHFLKYTLREAGVGTNPVKFEILLRQGATIIANYTHTSLSTNYVLFSQELTTGEADAITDYTDLEVTLTASCDSNCSNQEREKVNVSWVLFIIEQVSAPPIESLELLTVSSIRVTWLSEDVDGEISDIIIQRMDGTDFISVGNVSSATTTFDDTGLDEQKIIDYRLQGMLSGGGFSSASKVITGATPPSSTTINSNGTVIEPSASNSLSLLDKQIFTHTVEHYNITTAEVGQIFTDIDTNQLNLYEIIDKMNNGSYSSSQEMRNAGAFYGTKYLLFQDISDFIGNVTQNVVIALGGSNGTGDNPNFGVDPPDS